MELEIIDRESIGTFVKFTANILKVFTQGKSKIRRGETTLWVSMEDLACKCPKIRLNRKYLVVSKDSKSGGRSGFTLSRKSKVIPWKDRWERRIRKYQKAAKFGKCHQY